MNNNVPWLIHVLLTSMLFTGLLESACPSKKFAPVPGEPFCSDVAPRSPAPSSSESTVVIHSSVSSSRGAAFPVVSRQEAIVVPPTSSGGKVPEMSKDDIIKEFLRNLEVGSIGGAPSAYNNNVCCCVACWQKFKEMFCCCCNCDPS